MHDLSLGVMLGVEEPPAAGPGDDPARPRTQPAGSLRRTAQLEMPAQYFEAISQCYTETLEYRLQHWY